MFVFKYKMSWHFIVTQTFVINKQDIKRKIQSLFLLYLVQDLFLKIRKRYKKNIYKTIE